MALVNYSSPCCMLCLKCQTYIVFTLSKINMSDTDFMYVKTRCVYGSATENSNCTKCVTELK